MKSCAPLNLIDKIFFGLNYSDFSFLVGKTKIAKYYKMFTTPKLYKYIRTVIKYKLTA